MLNRKLFKLALIFIFTILLFKCDQDDNKSKDNLPKPESQGLEVQATVVKKGTLKEYIETSAIIEARQKGDITSRVSAPIKKVLVTEGQIVNKGDTLFVLDDRQIKNRLTSNRSDFIKAVSELVLELESSGQSEAVPKWKDYRLKAANNLYNIPLYPEPKTAKMTVILSRLGIQSEYNTVKEYELQLKNCFITAPFSGTVSEIQVYPGAQIATGSELCKITDLSTMQLNINILEEDIAHIEEGTEVDIIGNNHKKTKIATILPEIDEKGHTGTAIAYLDNSNYHYKNGQHLQVRVVRDKYYNRLYIPRSALLNRNDRDLVFLVKKGIAKWYYVNLGAGNSSYVEISRATQTGDPIVPGDTVVTGGHYSLAHNVPVKVNNF